jgi:hypothetical protein
LGISKVGIENWGQILNITLKEILFVIMVRLFERWKYYHLILAEIIEIKILSFTLDQFCIDYTSNA